MADKHSRRDFVLRSASLIAVGLAAPAWLSSLARAGVSAQARGKALPGAGKTLVVCQLSGGNDGLNTVIPYSAQPYYKLRPSLAIPEKSQIQISDSLALHPALRPVHALWESGELAIVNGVGYPNPNRSHFASMSIWQTGDPGGHESSGWLGRYLEAAAGAAGKPNPLLALSFGRERVEALGGSSSSVPTFASLEDVRGLVGDSDAERALRAIQQGPAGGMGAYNSGVSHAGKATNAALDAMDALAARLDQYQPSSAYGSDDFGQGFRNIAHLLGISPETRVIYFAAGGFDTHAQQAQTHEELLGRFSAALATFMKELQAMGRSNDVTVMVFSEFGRRVEENGSAGTDHGAAGPMFLAGGGIKGGLYGAYPSLTDLADGDLKFNTDFRQVYSTVLQDWLGADSAALLGASYKPLGLFA
ncbi:DUF1501 domain-containing protein [bacterium]|nr:DUF1501 domain-containing protein [bacterium]